MSHNHSHGHSHDHSATKNIATAFFLNLFFAIIELFGGLFTNSVAILSDAVHDFGDALSLGVAWYLQKVSVKKGDNRFSYGYKRFSLLGSIFISVVLVVGSVFIVTESVKRLASPQETDATGMVILAILGIIVNGAAVLRLKKGTSLNEKAVMIHLMEDVLGWVAVLIGGILMHFWNATFIDPLLSILITIWVLYNVYKNLTSTIAIMLQQVPEGVDLEALKKEFATIENAHSLHDLHVWSLDGESHIMSVHLVMQENVTRDQVQQAKQRLKELANNKGIGHVTVEVEFIDEASRCKYYQDPC
ncbi:MAG: cation diffusion facilitator family transporter [Bacteroidales bacterium]|nr:cation diffusion facilitator family transporter [Bacteroidales bacterium]MDD4656884.1 cation diffusion facilitator family transporter [Bacteroidales bacterium]